MKTIATILLAVAIAVMVIEGFSWIWLGWAILAAIYLAIKAFARGVERTFESG